MFQRRIPESLRHAPNPGIKGVAMLAAAESATRGILLSVFPIVIYRNFGDAESVSEVYFTIGLASFVLAIMSPWISRFVPRRWFYSFGVVGIAGGAVLTGTSSGWLVGLGLGISTLASVITSICFNAYVMDYVERNNLGEFETTRLFYSGTCWAAGPFLGVWLMGIWEFAPFAAAVLAGSVQLTVFWVMRLGNGKVISRARGPAANPLAYLPRFFAQPRLIAGWTFAVVRSSAWWVYIIYVPIYVVESGYSEQLGGLVVSIANSFLFITPFMLRWMKARSIRQAVLTGFACSGFFFCLAAVMAQTPEVTVIALVVASIFLVLLDICAGLPFLMAVKPSERTEMSAVYATYRDVSGAITPGVVRGVLAFATLPAAFAVAGVALLVMVPLGLKVNKRLGQKRVATTA
jgi:MFS transporter, ACDE family, multidrug resistance protein